jgi:group II intron reverse transcriptase/maturase
MKNISQQSKAVHDVIIGTMGSSKRRKSYGFGGFVVELMTRRKPEIRQFHTKSNINPAGGVAKECETDISYDGVTKVIHDIANIKNLTLAYEYIKSKPGNMTSRSYNQTLGGISLEWLNQLSFDLRAGKFQFTPANIPKPGKNETRPLGVVSPRDKVVQTAILQVLEPIYETIFLDCSHGFRPNRGCHTALRSLKHKFSNSSWVIEGDISKCYDLIDHDILLRILKKKIKCDKTLALLKFFLKNPFKDYEQFVWSKKGIFQASSLSPLLCNIYLHEMDLYIKNLKQFFNTGKRRRKSPDYIRIQYVLSKKSLNLSEKKNLKTELRKFRSKDPFDPNFRRLNYVRYADKFVIGVIGSKKNCIQIREDLSVFLSEELSLNLSKEKTTISHFNKNGIFFLETSISGNWEKDKVVKLVSRNKLKLKVRTTSRTRMFAPVEKILKKSVEENMFKRLESKKFAPTAVRRMVNYDHADIIRFFNSKIRGILNYYSFVDNAKSLGIIVHSLKHSCALTLALKYKLRHRSKVFKKFGKYLECRDTGVKFFIPKTFARSQKFQINPTTPDSIFEVRWNNKLTRSNLNHRCLICGKTPSEMHHVKRIKNLKTLYRERKIDYWTLQMAVINRKQIPLCKDHHIALHQGQLLSLEVEKLSKSIKKFKK